MIISASYKTDIPTFYGEWFKNRLAAGYCMMVNPYNRRPQRVDLSRGSVDGFIFWTKNLGPFLDVLKIVEDQGFPFIVEYTINAYPRNLEFSVVDSKKSVEHMASVAENFGPNVGVWRYDPIVFSSVTPPDFHRDKFERLAASLEGITDEVVISFAQIYKKTRRNMDEAATEFGFSWEDPQDSLKLSLAADLAQMATKRGIRLTMCSQDKYLAPGISPAKCVDAERLSLVAGYPILAELKGNRPDCGCFASKDIGEYDTCPHGCVYCYAVQNRGLAKSRYQDHDPSSEFLFTPKNLSVRDPLSPQTDPKKEPVQIPLL
ncbi:MAG: DUF1848 domain-containing protein [Chloroflexi bacterium]|nr:DUF1848 domain-containing protein [Chloroflexota bacterium]MDA1271322.1 DUF1848 domain-containing protein [Chloroflexota bacterium]PKB58212.1 MAG: DNA repair photolyase [SAR202 cluster bacterium Casp-Chloro-G2]